ncbi:HAD-IIB family hydrolase, partial [Rhodovulum sulfidophilum]|uniref:HAD-IIB family hydrolase n=1 Tax=Rhodovulum sulfidophilum TaxID=35806 RepID=UPI001F1B9025
MPRPALLIFTDLDGTLLDHETYSHAEAAPALTALRAAGVPVILASSKTAAEIAPLRAELGLSAHPD